MKTPNILVVGSVTMDLIVSSPRFPQSGETVIGSGFQTAPGGKGANQAVQAARLGASVDMVGRVGDDAFGCALIDSLRSAGVDTSHVIVTPGVSTAVANVQLEVGDGSAANRIIVVPGANYRITPDDVAFLENEITNYDMVILQHEIPAEVNASVIRVAHENGVPVMLNPAPYAPIDGELLKMLAFVSPNEHEAADITGIFADDERHIRDAAQELLSRGVGGVLITLGDRGAAFADECGFVRVPCVPNVEPRDTTAAGDSFVAAFCTELCRGATAERAMIFADCAAAITVSRMGAQPSLPTRPEVEELMQKCRITPISAE